MFIAAFYTITTPYKQLSPLITNEWMKKMIYIEIYIYIYVFVCVCVCASVCMYVCNGILLAIKNEIMSFAGKYVELEIITLNKISQTQKLKYRMLSLIYGTYT
jgi:hypothetical protein